MLTFIRIHLPSMTLASPGAVDRIRALAHRKPADPEPEPVQNPWKGELDRLKKGLRSETDQAKFGISGGYQPIEPPPAPPPPLPPAQQFKRGTLTDLKIWWGKATVYKTPDPRELNRFAPVAPKKKNRWLQF